MYSNNRKELAQPLINNDFKLKNPLVSIVYIQIFQFCKGSQDSACV